MRGGIGTADVRGMGERARPTPEATVGRLLRSQTDIGNVVKAFYGDAARDELTHSLGRDREPSRRGPFDLRPVPTGCDRLTA